MAWRLAKSLNVYRGQVDAMAPSRNRASDGTIGDPDHQLQGARSDHNPQLITGLGAVPVVTAIDITHDPAGGCNFAAIAEALRASRDRRIEYVIYHERLFSSYPTSSHPAWSWRPYAGDNPHTRHGHLSVLANHLADSVAPWQIGDIDMTQEEHDLLVNAAWRLDGIANGLDTFRGGAISGQPNELTRTLRRIEARLAEIGEPLPVQIGDALGDALKEPSVLAALAAILPAAPTATDVAEAVVARAHNGPQA